MFKIGADPELFLKLGNEFVSAEDNNGPLIPGTKRKPFKVKGGAIQVDGVAAEFNIEPAEDFTQFVDNIKSVVKTLKKRIQNVNPELKLVPTPTALFKPDYFFRLPEHTLELGCEPDYNAYKEGAANPRPKTSKPLRTGSGHIHIGWTENVDPTYEGHLKDCCLVVKQLDKYLLTASYDWDDDELRRELYGALGSFRPKSYGVEYRPLSNAWLKNWDSVNTVYSITTRVLEKLDNATLDLDTKIKRQEKGKNIEYIWSKLG